MPVMKVLNKGKPVKIWTDDIDDNALQQLENMSKVPFIHKHIAVMPDVHWGCGATIGSVIPSRGAVIPAAVGVDLGCGMMALRTSLTASDLPDNLHDIRSDIERLVPHGRSDNGRAADVGGYSNTSDSPHLHRWAKLGGRYNMIIAKHPKAKAYNTWNHMGTLGTGNHFIEICLDEADKVWAVIHSGSRGVGNKIGSYFIQAAKMEMDKYFITDNLPDKDLSYLVEHTELFDDYGQAVMWAQDFAAENRKAMMESVISVLRARFGPITLTKEAINCHHNYISRENHFGANVIVTRKGAIRAREGDLGIIPGSMGAKTFIVSGRGNKESFCSCSHGAGRRLGRKQAIREYDVKDLEEQTKGIECPKDVSRLDEIPAAYKDIDTVMSNQSDLVEVLHTLHQVINVKG